MSRETWENVAKRFDPDAPPAPKWRAERDVSPVDDICRALNRPFETPHVLLTGTRGTGKTTELLRLAERRTAEGDFVVFLDLARHFSDTMGDTAALQRIAAWEVCYLAGVALIRAAEERFGIAFPDDHRRELQEAWNALATATETPAPAPAVDVGALAKSMVLLVSAATPAAPAAAVGLKALEGVAGAVRWSMGVSKRKVGDQDVMARHLLACVNRLFATFRQKVQRALFVIDGLDFVQDLDRAEDLFVESEMIGSLDCALVLCGPFILRNHMASTLARRFSEVVTLANVPVLLDRDPRRHGPGVRFLSELYGKRVADLQPQGLVEAPDLERLAYYSGGRLRDYVKSIRMLAGEAWSADATRATPELVDRVIKKARLLMETGIDRGHLDVLEQVVRDPQHLLPEDGRARELLKYGRLLPYSNGSEWSYPHPLLTINLVRAEPPGSNP